MVHLPNGTKRQINPSEKMVETSTVFWNWTGEVPSKDVNGWPVENEKVVLDEEIN